MLESCVSGFTRVGIPRSLVGLYFGKCDIMRVSCWAQC